MENDAEALEEYRWLCETVKYDYGAILLKLSILMSSKYATTEEKLTLPQAIKNLRNLSQASSNR